MKLCILGNSHVAMLMLADRAAPSDDLALTFFAKPAGGPEGARIDGTTLIAEDPELQERLDAIGTPQRLDLMDFDAVVLVGEVISAFSAIALLRRHFVTGWPSAASHIAAQATPLSAPNKRALLSPAAFHAALVAANHAKLSHRLALEIRAACPLPLMLVPQPYPAARMLQDKAKYPVFRRVHQAGDGPHLAAALTRAQAESFVGIENLHLIAQPDETIAKHFFTRDDFSRGAMRLSLNQALPEDDVLHAGPDYGRLILDRMVAAVTDLV
ncbi:hypothetical protein [Pseudooceanicola sp.]|uniref:hypothetical protein n=1 Tax=Pseudooceanicola sp. TaxID=1914328 RepID=UPI0026252F9D|nr:hypothetical protein [Pseudooceanicola sp.]MDF1853858.1 hypothetical protein [Pseudooceanicola sp.]